MAGVIPIQNVSAKSLDVCKEPSHNTDKTIKQVEAVIYELGERMPMERILDLKVPDELLDDRKGEIWSTDTLLGTLALDRGAFSALN